MSVSLEKKIADLVRRIPELIRNFDYRKGPDLYFYKRSMKTRRSRHLSELLDEPDGYLELIYATLVAWDMNSRGAKMKYFDESRSSILGNKERFLQLSSLRLETLPTGTFGEAKMLCGEIYDNMHLMMSEGRLVSNSKVMHFLLPDLVMPYGQTEYAQFLLWIHQ